MVRLRGVSLRRHSDESTAECYWLVTFQMPYPQVLVNWESAPGQIQPTVHSQIQPPQASSFYIFKRLENQKKNHLMTCENYMKFRFRHLLRFHWHRAPLAPHIVCGGFALWWQSWGVTTDMKVTWPAKLKIFTVWPWIENLLTPTAKCLSTDNFINHQWVILRMFSFFSF